VISRASQVVVGIADALMVAHLGADSLAATTAGALNAYALFILPMGVVFIVASFSSQLTGAGDPAGARRYGWHGLSVAAAALVLSVASIPAVPAVLDLAPYEPSLRNLLGDYLSIRLFSAGAVVGIEALANYYGGLGNTRLPMRASLAAMAMNVAGNWLLIDGHLGLPSLGVRGAALASTVATCLAFAGLLAAFLRDGRAVAAGRLRWSELVRLLRFGVPSGLNWFFEFMAFAFFLNLVMADLGTVPLAAFMTVIQVNSLAFMPAFALASAGAILVGQAIGAGRRDDAPGLVGVTFAVSACWQGAVGLLYLVAPGAVLGPFARDPATATAFVETAGPILLVSVAWQLFDAGATTLAESLRAAGDTAYVLYTRLAVGWLVFVPGSWAAVNLLGAGPTAASTWLVAYLGLLAGALLLRFRSGAWRRIQLVEPAPA
jgi:MATE family multidrug resistance protein